MIHLSKKVNWRAIQHQVISNIIFKLETEPIWESQNISKLPIVLRNRFSLTVNIEKRLEKIRFRKSRSGIFLSQKTSFPE